MNTNTNNNDNNTQYDLELVQTIYKDRKKREEALREGHLVHDITK